MKNQKVQCFEKDAFQRFLNQQTSRLEENAITEHIETCDRCRNLLASIAGDPLVEQAIEEHLGQAGQEETTDLDVADEQRQRQRELRKVRDLLAPTEHPEMIGRLGNYQVSGVIGRGSAGIVVKALDTRLNRYVAIKLLAPAYSNNGCSRRRFEREGRAIASVKDPHVVPIHLVDEFQGTPFIVMQYLPDGSLFQRIRKQGPLSTEEVVCVGMQIAKGLAAAHRRGIVHRDVKPANVLLENGLANAMVTDFGLARVVDEATMTRSGSISGTPQYMSPEQAKGERVDPRSDLFSLGSVMYAAATGHAPFKSESVFGVIKKVCESEPMPVRDYNPEIAPWLVGLIEKLHAKEPSGRFESADAVADILASELAHLQSPTQVIEPTRPWWVRPKPESTGRNRRLVGAALVVGLVGSMIYGLSFLPTGMGSKPDATVVVETDKDKDRVAIVRSTIGKASLVDGLRDAEMYLAKIAELPAEELLEITTQENQKVERFVKTKTKSFDVQKGGQLFLRSNLGAVIVQTHDRPTVELKMVHVVGAENQANADRFFNAVELEFGFDGEVSKDAMGDLQPGRDCVITAKFPLKRLNQVEIEKANNLDELKEQLLIRNNSHYKNAEFRVLVPKTFDLDVETAAGPIMCQDIDGSLKATTKGGSVEIGNVTETATIFTEGGAIVAGNFGADAKLFTQGGQIEVGDVKGELEVETYGGQIAIGHVQGQLKASTRGGRIRIDESEGHVEATSQGGQIDIYKAHESVVATTMNGALKVNFVDTPTKPVKLTCPTGSIKIGYAPGFAAKISATSSLSRVSAPFLEGNAKHIEFQLKGGETKMDVVSNTGSIKFREIDVDDLDRDLELLRQQRKELKASRIAQKVFNRAYDIHMQGRIEEAVEAHKEAAKHEDFKGIATYNLGCAYALLGKTDMALDALDQSLEYGFWDRDYWETDEDLDSLRELDRFKELLNKVREKTSASISTRDNCCSGA